MSPLKLNFSQQQGVSSLSGALNPCIKCDSDVPGPCQDASIPLDLHSVPGPLDLHSGAPGPLDGTPDHCMHNGLSTINIKIIFYIEYLGVHLFKGLAIVIRLHNAVELSFSKKRTETSKE